MSRLIEFTAQLFLFSLLIVCCLFFWAVVIMFFTNGPDYIAFVKRERERKKRLKENERRRAMYMPPMNTFNYHNWSSREAPDYDEVPRAQRTATLDEEDRDFDTGLENPTEMAPFLQTEDENERRDGNG